MDHLSAERFTVTPEIDYATPEYAALFHETSGKLPPNHNITYVPFSASQIISDAEHINYANRAELPAIMANADAVLCISRDEEPTPTYTDQYPEYNITATPSAYSNVDASAALWKIAQSQGNDSVKFIATGRMNNRAIRAMMALPLISEHIGLNAEDFYHTPEPRFRQLLEAGFTRANIGGLLGNANPDLKTEYKALAALFEDPKYSASIPTAESTDEELQKAMEAVWQEYKTYPRISTSRLMTEQAAHLGVPMESIYEEDGAVDTITNLINTAEMLSHDEGLKDSDIRRIVIVAGSDHLPRTMWIADHILPDNIELVFVESDPALSQTSYNESCAREHASFKKVLNGSAARVTYKSWMTLQGLAILAPTARTMLT